MTKKYFYILTYSISLICCSNKVYGQCQIDSVYFNLYNAISLSDERAYKSTDSTLNYDIPNVSWIDVYENGLIQKRILANSKIQNRTISFLYENQKVVEIKDDGGIFKKTILIEYDKGKVSKVLFNSLLGIVEYKIEHVKNGYRFNYFNTETKKEDCKYVDVKMLEKCGIRKFGNIDFLDDEFQINHTNRNCYKDKEENDYQFPNTEMYEVICRMDKCGNTTVHSKQNRETGAIILLYEKRYIYK